ILAQTMSGSLTVPLSATDADGDALTFSAAVVTPSASLYQLEQQLQLTQYNNTYYTNLWGLGDKWLLGPNNQWYALMPDGSLYRWTQTLSQTLQPANMVAN